eukprot:SAG31_NODE_3575_length_4110_cov_2.432560_8_plen_62_part_00
MRWNGRAWSIRRSDTGHDPDWACGKLDTEGAELQNIFSASDVWDDHHQRYAVSPVIINVPE